MKRVAFPPFRPQMDHPRASEDDAGVAELGRCWRESASRLPTVGRCRRSVSVSNPCPTLHGVHMYSPVSMSLMIPAYRPCLGNRSDTRHLGFCIALLCELFYRKQVLKSILELSRGRESRSENRLQALLKKCSERLLGSEHVLYGDQETYQTNACHNAKGLNMRRRS